MLLSSPNKLMVCVCVRQTITSLLQADAATSVSSAGSSAEPSWLNAEAYHYLMLAQRHLYAQSYDAALKAALRLVHYEAVLPSRVLYSTIALAAFHAQFYQQCSTAFMKLELLEGIPQAERDAYKALAFAIFSRQAPVDPVTREFKCPNPQCQAAVHDWSASRDVITCGHPLNELAGTCRAQCAR